ncbi:MULTISPECIES: hypothetical protein [Streptomyces]|uniref:Uncharacterized protein n=1 Tax=Streptomyces ramulosus TaxID=47762 RepID=A0ABW1FKZ6_9ACTN
MPRSTALANGARITGGMFCLVFFLYTGFWICYDLAEFGLPAVWDFWTGARPPGRNLVSNSTQFCLALVQLSGAVAAFTGRRTAGGLMAVATVFTFATAAQTMISVGSHTGDDRWFRNAQMDADPFDAVFLGSLALALLTFVAAIVLLAGMRSWPRPAPSLPPMRPARAAGVIGGLVLGAMALFSVIWQLYMLVQSGDVAGTFLILYLGRGILASLTSLSPGWDALVLMVLAGIAALNCLIRGTAARGLALGLATMALPNALLMVIGPGFSGQLFTISDAAPGQSILGIAQVVLDLLGSLALFALMAKGEPVAPGWQPPAPAPQFGGPGFVPPGPQPTGWQPPGPPPGGPMTGGPMPGPMPGGPVPAAPVPPQAGPVPPMPMAGPAAPPIPPTAPPVPPGNPPAPGGFGPPPL